jgi:isopenicillin-N epimerase
VAIGTRIERAPPAPLGEGIAGLWQLDPSITFLNHGSFGATPRAVLEAQSRWRRHIETRPVELLHRRRDAMMAPAKAAVGGLVGASPRDLAAVTNATGAVNAVLRSLPLREGQELLTTTHAYNAIRQALRYVARRSGAVLVEAPVPFPLHSPDRIVDAIAAALSERTRLVVVDHVTSPTAVVLPVRRIIELCADRGIDVLIDGAHAPGMVPLCIEELAPAWYAGNLHKWVCAPKGAAFLWARPDRQAEVHPTTISHHLDEGFEREFAWQGTRDITAFLAAANAIEFMEGLGWDRVRRHNHEMAVWAQQMLCARFGVDPATPADGSMLGSMATVPLPPALQGRGTAEDLQAQLYERHAIEVPVLDFGGSRWVRVSCQVYNGQEDYERLADVLQKIS